QMPRAVGEIDPFQCLQHAPPALGSRYAPVYQADFDVLGDIQIVDQVEILKHKANTCAAVQGELFLRAACDVLAHEPVGARGGRVDETQYVQQGGLAASGGPMIARNSPWPTSRLRSSSAAVSTSSARKILETCSSFSIDAPSVCQDNAIGLFQCRVIGSNHLFADSQSAQDFQLLHGAAADLDTSALGETAPRSHDKHPVTTGTFQERTHRKDFRLRVVAQLQVTQQRL